jgi:hypothetical protein
MSLPVAQPPTNTPPLLVDDKGKITNAFVSPWLQWLVALWTSVRGPANTTPPANSAAVGVAGQLAQDNNFLYVYNGTTKTWKRIPLTVF